MLRVAIQMDPIEGVDIESDTTWLQAMEAQNRGYPVWVYDFRTLALEEGRLYCRARPVTLRQTVGDHVTFGDWERLDLGEDIDVIELNEAFAAQSLAVIKTLGLDADKVNVNGGAIALGHPLGCTGAKLTASILRELERRNGRYGMVTMCVGGGMGAAGILERIN